MDKPYRLFKLFGLAGTGVVIVAMIIGYQFAGEIYKYKDSVNDALLPEVDAIVCLAGGRGRISAAGDLWYRYWEQSHGPVFPKRKVPTLYFSGMGHQANWNVLSKQLRRTVLQAIRQNEVIIENESSNTDTNARWLGRFAQERHWKKIVLLTSSYHMRRASFIFDHVLKTNENPIEVETFSVYQEPFGIHEWKNEMNGIRVTLLEYLKWVYYRSVWRTF
jgi:uncharacterized SAM-binding protein YcdF (DUF218 family)